MEVEHVSAEADGGEGEDPGEGLGGGSGSGAEGGGVHGGEGLLDVGAGLVVGAPVVVGLLVEALLALGGELVDLLAELVDLNVLVVVVVVVIVGILVDLLARDGLGAADDGLVGEGEGAAVGVLGEGLEAVGGGDGAATVLEHAEADLLSVGGAVGADEVVDVLAVALELGALEVALDLELLLALVLHAVVLGLVALVHVVLLVVVLVLVLVLVHLALLAGDLALVLLLLHLGLGVGVEEVHHGGEVAGASLAAGGGAEGELDGVVGDEGTELVSAALLADGGGGVARVELDGVLVHPGDVALLLLLVLVLVGVLEVTDLVAADVLGVAHHALGGADGLGAAVDLAVGAAAGDGGDGEEEGGNGELHLEWMGWIDFVKVELNEL